MASATTANLNNRNTVVTVETGTPPRKKTDMEFSLSEEEMKKINYLGKLERKRHRGGRGLKDMKQNKFSDQLSLEAQIAMQLALKDTQAMKRGGKEDGAGSPSGRNKNSNNHVKFADEQATAAPPPQNPPPRPDTQCSKHSSFSDAFEKRGAARMSCDLTDANFEPSSVSKRSLDGTKVEVAMETVEIINHEERHQVDDDAIEQIAQRNSVEKCLVWMEVLAKEGQIPKTSPTTDTEKPAKHKTSKSGKSHRTHERNASKS